MERRKRSGKSDPRRDRDSRINKRFIQIDQLISSSVLIMVFALFCSARVGYFWLIVLLGAPFLSLVICRIAAHCSSAEILDMGGIYEKGEKIYAHIRIVNRSVIPCGCYVIKISGRGSLGEIKDCEKKLFIAPRSEKAVIVELDTGHSGLGTYEITGAFCKDYLGVFSSKIPLIGESYVNLGILPVPRTDNSRSPIIEQSFSASQGLDDMRETMETAYTITGGFPGYEYREYVPGDPLKRISSKVSAKRDILMVRLDEKLSASGCAFFADPVTHRDENGEYRPEVWDSLIENMIGMTSILVARDFSVRLIYRNEKEWEYVDCMTRSDIAAAAEALAMAINSECGYEGADRIPPMSMIEGFASFTAFSATPDAHLSDMIAKLRSDKLSGLAIFDANREEGRIL